MKTILSIDGGGVRGIIPLCCLVRLEAQEGKPCHELFDMVAGTSTGAIITAGIALGVSARGLLALYREMACDAFQRLPWWKVALNLGNHRYSNSFIDKVLTELGADIPINDLPIDVLITAKNTVTSRTDFFVRDKPSNASLWGALPLKDAVLASIAAPTYFPAHKTVFHEREYAWVDGGVGVAGNPCYQAAVEAIHYSGDEYPPGETRMLSFGTGRGPHPIQADEANYLEWASWVIAEMLEDSADWQTFTTRLEYDRSARIDFRRYQLDLAHDVMQLLGVPLDPEVDLSSIGMDAVWALEILEQIGRAFAEKIDFSDPHGMELATEEGW